MDVLALTESPGHVCGRYRLLPFRPALEARGHRLSVSAVPRAPLARAALLAGVGRFDVVIVQRKLLGRLELALLRSRCRRLVFDFDDAVFSRDSYDPRGPLCPRRAGRFAAMMRAADLVLAGNEFLLARAIHFGTDPSSVAVVPTCVDPELYPAATRSAPPPPVRLVWIGSSSTLQGLEARRDLWDRLGRAVPGLAFRIVCDRFPDLGALPVEPVAWSEAAEAPALATADLGISWVPDDLWSRGKCGLKVLQYMAAGLPVIANPVGVHSEMIDPGGNGLLPVSEDEWVESIRFLAAEPALRAEMGRASRRRAQADYSVSAWADRWADLVVGPGPIGSPAPAASALPAPAPHLSGPGTRVARHHLGGGRP
jgi:hypothetical protein